MKMEKLQHLLGLYLDGGLTQESKESLEQLLLSSPVARKEFWQQTNLHAMLLQISRPMHSVNNKRFTA
ncbi:hypothetical protein [Aporhodopirellula aestuarii]|uniref:Zinc-finger domain-containing protein n=1 Tax=Aporhodopirellula aestuarii TaxID=2950107 RepID=A0ABT0U354_9BACT|nr:hypothetical protein [Aporhodopirellula aestuarii]MCM2371312.1 hypothetical protein [Aporhodopirellula aestuarii]